MPLPHPWGLVVQRIVVLKCKLEELLHIGFDSTMERKLKARRRARWVKVKESGSQGRLKASYWAW